MNREEILQRLLDPDYVKAHFTELAKLVFNYQYERNAVYRSYLDKLRFTPNDLTNIVDIPCLPIEAFKLSAIKSYSAPAEMIFESSGTTGAATSKHHVRDVAFYKRLSTTIFQEFYGSMKDYCVIGLLPSYLERNNSSLVAMVDHFIKQSADSDSGFYLDEYDKLYDLLIRKRSEGKKTLVIGVSFALLDFAEHYKADLSGIIFMETGGMKGRKKEIPRDELHAIISGSFNLFEIHSEYGMTELLSQSYSKGNGLFQAGYTMRCISKQITDPFSSERNAKTGLLNIIDLGNIDSCSFIETQDLVRIYDTDRFEIIGRLDQSDLRGCNLLLS